MRRFISLVVLAAVVAAVLATTALARTESKFSAIADGTHQKQRDHAFILKGKLREPHNRSNVLGHFRAKFRRGGHIGAVFTFDNGKIKASGNRNHNKVPIVGGTRHWNGASGKLLIRNRNHNNALLKFDVVQ
jgi:Ni/Co efflux regulator RcnB